MIRSLGVFLLLFAAAAVAGGGPETTLVVVNAASPASRLVANEYVKARGIPRSHVIALSDVPLNGIVPLDAFLERIWKPIAAHMAAEKIDGQIDLITYSVDFPFGVDFRERVGDRMNPQIGGRASLTGVTYLIRSVLAEEEFWDLQVNRYYGLDLAARGRQLRRPTAEESSSYAQAVAALQRKDYANARVQFEKFLDTYKEAGDPWYNYACVLALLGRTEEALKALDEAATAGFQGAAHAAQDPDLAALRGRPEFRAAVARMGEWSPEVRPPNALSSATDGYFLSTQLGYTGRWGNSVPEVQECLRRAIASDGTRPDGTVYILRNGDVRSTAREPFFAGLRSKLAAHGRKVEQLDGVLPPQKSDVVGAVIGSAGFSWGSCGSTMLPGAIAEHLTSHGGDFSHGGQTKISELLRHGAAGSSGTVAEPFAIHQKFPNPLLHVFYAEGLDLAEAFYRSVYGPYQLMVAGDGLARPFANFEKLEVKAPPAPWIGTVSIEVEGARGRMELWVDGRRLGDALSLDTTALEDGHHEVRVVSVSTDPTATRSSVVLPALVKNGKLDGTAKLLTKPVVAYGEPIVVETNGREGKLTFRSEDLGPGPLDIVPHFTLSDGRKWRGPPLAVMVEPPAPIAEGKLADHPRLPGLRGAALTAGGGQALLVGARFGPIDARRVTLDGEIEAPADGLYQLFVAASGTLDLEIAGTALASGRKVDGETLLAIGLGKGWHPIHIDLEPRGKAQLGMMLGGAVVLDEPHLRHSRYAALLKEEPVVAGAEAGKPIAVAAEGVVLEWKKTAPVGAVAIFPAADAKDFPSKWEVEAPSGTKWKAVKDAVLVSGPGFVEISFALTRTRRLRLVPAAATSVARFACAGAPVRERPR